jgi:hypothetical protein
LNYLRKYKHRCKQLKDQLKTVENFNKGTKALDKFLSLQKIPSNEFGLEYEQVLIVKGSSPITQIDVEDDMSCDDTSKEYALPPMKMYKIKREYTEKEENKEDDELRQILADLKELRESDVNMKTQLEETKRREEVVRKQLNKREESCHKLEEKVVNLRKKVEKSNTQVKFLNNSMILDDILDSQISPNEKTDLGYHK